MKKAKFPKFFFFLGGGSPRELENSILFLFEPFPKDWIENKYFLSHRFEDKEISNVSSKVVTLSENISPAGGDVSFRDKKLLSLFEFLKVDPTILQDHHFVEVLFSKDTLTVQFILP